MMKKIKLIFYYFLISKLPHSRLSGISNRIRCWYMESVLNILEKNKNNFFEPNVYIGSGKNVKIGQHSHINENVFIQGAKIGSYVMIAPDVSILTQGHEFKSIDIPMINQGETKELIPIIEDNVWIGRNAIIMPGIKIGRGSIVGAGAVVTKDVHPFSIVGGVPAKFIKKRE